MQVTNISLLNKTFTQAELQAKIHTSRTSITNLTKHKISKQKIAVPLKPKQTILQFLKYNSI